MAEYRTVRMDFWGDPFIEALPAEGKLFYLYLMTCSHTNNLGLLEITRRRMAFETGLDQAKVDELLAMLEAEGKLVTDGDAVWLRNFIRHQTSTSPMIIKGLTRLYPQVGSSRIRADLCGRYPDVPWLTAQTGPHGPHGPSGPESGGFALTAPGFEAGFADPLPMVPDLVDGVADLSQGVSIAIPKEEREGEREGKDLLCAPAAPDAPRGFGFSAVSGRGQKAAALQAGQSSAGSSGQSGQGARCPAANQEPYMTRRKRQLHGKRLAAFNRFWRAFAYTRGKAEAADAWLDIPELTDALVGKIIAAAEREAASRADLTAAGRTPKMAQGWLSGRRWEDGEDLEEPGRAAGPGIGLEEFAAISREREKSARHGRLKGES